jgi:hypothetical protein
MVASTAERRTMPEIKTIQPLLPWSSIDPDSGSVGVDVELKDGRTYSFSVATPQSAVSSMSRHHESYFVSLPPPIIVQRLDPVTLRATFATLFATDDEAMLKRYQVQMQ